MKKLIALLLAVLMCVSLCACGKDSTSGETQPNASQGSQSSNETTAPTTESSGAATEESTEPTPAPGIALSDDLADFTVSIEGVVYQLPCGVDQLLNNGWSEGREYTYEVTANDTCAMELWNSSGKSVSVTVFNPGPDTKTYSECMILEISQSIWASDSENATVLIAGGFDVNANLTTNAVTAAFGGEENEHYHNSNSYGLYYEYEPGHYLFANLDESAAKWAIKIEKSVIRELYK